MPKLILRGAFLRFVDLRYDERSKQTYTRLNFSADYSDRVQEAMKWQPLPEGFAAASLDGELSLTDLVLIPNGAQLKQHTLELSAKEMSGFSLAKVKAADGETEEVQLRFQVVSSDTKAAKKMQEYLSVIGKGQGQLKVDYAAQSDLEMQAEKAAEQGELISPEQAADTAEPADGEPALAAVHEMGTPRGGRQKRRGENVN